MERRPIARRKFLKHIMTLGAGLLTASDLNQKPQDEKVEAVRVINGDTNNALVLVDVDLEDNNKVVVNTASNQFGVSCADGSVTTIPLTPDSHLSLDPRKTLNQRTNSVTGRIQRSLGTNVMGVIPAEVVCSDDVSARAGYLQEGVGLLLSIPALEPVSPLSNSDK